jgi:ribonuclease P protein component
MEKGRVSHSSFFLLRARKDDSVDHARISAVAPQKTAKTAAERNRLRRRIYEAVAPLYSGLSQNIHAIVFAKPGAAAADFETISEDIKNLFVKADVLK